MADRGRVILKRGDLFNATCPVIAHGCNTQGAFGSGVAGQIAAKWPNVRAAYLAKHRDEGWRLGDVQFVDVDHPRTNIVANLATQEKFGRDPNVQYVDYRAIRDSVSILLNFAEAMGVDVAMPRIGCGLGGGDWGIVEWTLRECVRGRTINIEVWSP